MLAIVVQALVRIAGRALDRPARRTVALMAFIGYHAREAQKDPTPYMMKTAEYVRARRMRATHTPGGRTPPGHTSSNVQTPDSAASARAGRSRRGWGAKDSHRRLLIYILA